MHNSAARRIFSAFLCAVMLFLSAGPTIGALKVYAGETGEPPLPAGSVWFEEQSVVANDDNIVIFTVKRDGDLSEPLTVYYHTENRSAIAGQEYWPVNDHAVIPAEEDEVSVAVCTYGSTTYGVTTDAGTFTRGFAIRLDRTSDPTVTVREDGGLAYGYLRYEYAYRATVNGRFAYLNEYDNEQYSELDRYVNDIDGGETWESWNEGMSLNNATTQKWVRDFLKVGLAKAYGTMLIKDYSYNANFHLDDSKIWFGDQNYINGGAALAYYEIEHCYNSIGGRLTGRANKLFTEGKNPHDYDGDLWDKQAYSGISDTKTLYFTNNTKEWYAEAGKLYYSQFYRAKPAGGILNLGAAFYNGASWQDDQLHDLFFILMLVDDTAPAILSENGSYLDDSSLASTGELRIILRFTEPVYVNSQNATVAVTLYDTAGQKITAAFGYEGGNYSDTLTFTWKNPTKRDYVAYSYKLENTSNEKYCDLSYKLSDSGKASNLQVPDTESDVISIAPIHFVTPEVSYSVTESGWSKYHEVDVTVSNLQAGTLYYLWDTNKDDVKNVEQYGSNRIDFIDGGATLTFSQVDGSYYLHTLVVSPYGLTASGTAPVMKFDNTAPALDFAVVRNELKTKEFTFSFFDTAGSATLVGGGGIADVKMAVDTLYGVKQYTIYDAATGETDPGFATFKEKDGVYTGKFYASLVGLMEDGTPAAEGTTPAIPADPRILDAMRGQSRGEITVWFIVTDTCGNRTTSAKKTYVFDARDTVDVNVAFTGGDLDTTQSDVPVYVVGADGTLSVTFTTTQSDGHLRLVFRDVSESTNGSILYHDLPLEGLTLDAAEGDEKSVTLTGLVPGYYEITPYFVLDDGGEGDGILVAETSAFYVSRGLSDKTKNYKTCEEDLVLRNEVVELNTSFYYLGLNGSAPASHFYGAVWDATTEKYVGGSPNPAFSSLSEAREYVKYMEYQDLYLVTINASQANFLNSGTGSTVYVKADGEKTFAEAGQRWIRYKRDSWTPASSAYGWVYYYYGESTLEDEGIDVRNLSATLRDAIFAVRDTICRAATTVYLVGDTDTAPATGAPFLKPEQIHTAYEEAAETRMHTPLAIPVAYPGDDELYVNTVRDYDEVDRPLASNLALAVGPYTRLFYRHGTIDGGEPYRVLDAQDGNLLRRLLVTQGVYTIYECDENGAHEYEVYVDTEAPSLKVYINDTETPILPDVLQYSGNTFRFGAMEGEIDRFAYVAVYTSNWRLLHVYYGSAIEGVELDKSNYYVEVGDRSGNTFIFFVRMAPEKLDVKAEKTESGSGVLVTVEGRTAGEIYRYEVWCNNVLVNNEFVARKLYTEPGVYTVYVQDIYGNESPHITVSYCRAAPSVTWSYLNSYGTYSAYNEQSTVAMQIKEDDEAFNRSIISTSTLLRFRLGEDNGTPAFSFEGLEKEDYSVDITGRTVTINKLSGWTLKVWYEEYPDNYVTYVCVVDNAAPTVNVSYIGTPYTPDERAWLSETLSLVPETLTYTLGTSTILSVSDGGAITSRYITVTAEDNFGVRSLSVTCDGKPVTGQGEDGSFTLKDYGLYRVTAVDIFGNTGVFTFLNTDHTPATFSVDGGTSVGGSLTDKLLGREDVTVTLGDFGECEILVTRGDARAYYRYRTEDGAVYAGRYEYVGEGEERDVSVYYDTRPSATLTLASAGEWLTLAEAEGYTVSVLFSNEGYASFRVTCDDGREDVALRVTTDEGLCPAYRAATLSRVGADIDVLAGDQPVATNRTGDVIWVAAQLSIPAVMSPDVARVEEAFSETTAFGTFSLFYDGEDYYAPIDHSRKGFYCVRVTDVFGNVVTYVFRYADAAGVEITATYTDGGTSVYSGAYEGIIRANGTLTVTVYGTGVRLSVNGEPVEGILDHDKTIYTLRTAGAYAVQVVDAAGITTDLSLEIGSDPTFAPDESWLAGYNEKALLRAERYTNQRLTVRPDATRVSQIYVRSGENLLVVYNLLAEEAINDPALCDACVGLWGDGVYEVCFRNAYGDLKTLTVNYRETPTLLLTRITAFSGIPERVSIEDALAHTFCSSNSLIFESESVRYTFTVNGDPVSLDVPLTYEFDSASGNASREFAIVYQDAYGFSYRFTAVLKRNTVPIDLSGMTIIEQDSTLYTKKDVFVTFPDDCTATVSFNGGDLSDYQSGQRLNRDGSYRFTVVDLAGNVSTVTVVRDSVVGYIFSSSSVADLPVLSGNVINDTALVFHPFVGDGAKILSVFFNGEEVKEKNEARFTATGHWEFILCDAVGNTSYFHAWLINHAVSRFDYEAPYGYSVSEVWWTGADGNRQLTTMKGDTISLTADGDYAVVLLSTWDNLAVNFTVTVDTRPPAVSLVGCEEGEETSRPVSFTGLSVGDTVEVFRDGVLNSRVVIEMPSDIPTITEAGRYTVVVRNAAGTETTMSFTHKYVANTATSVLIIVACTAVATGIFIGLLYRNRSKIDE